MINHSLLVTRMLDWTCADLWVQVMRTRARAARSRNPPKRSCCGQPRPSRVKRRSWEAQQRARWAVSGWLAGFVAFVALLHVGG